MLSSTRRSFLRLSSTPLSELRCFVVGSSRDLEIPSAVSARSFATSISSSAAPKTKISKARNAERGQKLEKKRNLRAVRAVKADVRLEEGRIRTMERVIEVDGKRVNAEELTDGMEPFSDQELEGMYLGLLGASPEEMAMPALTASNKLLLEAPSLEDGREERIQALEARLDTLAEEIDADGTSEALSLSLADRLKQRRAGKEVEVVGEKYRLDDSLQGPRRTINRLGALLIAAGEGDAASEDGSIALGIAVRSEWRDLIIACAEIGDVDGVNEGLVLVQRAIPAANSEIFTDVMAVYASQSRSKDALALAQFAQHNAFPISLVTHHHLIASILSSRVDVAISHLHSLEVAGHIPLQETYTLIIQHLLQPESPPHLVSRGWDLYAHSRLVAHPMPSPSLFSTMIQACSRGLHPSPERAIDLFTEMTIDNSLPPTEEAYNGVIRACACEGSQASYFEALRYMRQMLDANVPPSKHTFHAVLEGARRHGDLARARWMLVKMIEVGGAAAPDANSIGRVFLAYAANKVPLKGLVKGRKGGVVGMSSMEISSKSDPSKRFSSSAGDSPPAQAIIEALGESSLNYPGPLPQTSDELMMEARTLMLQCVPASALESPHSDPPSSECPSPSSIFPSVLPSTFLLNSYLEVLAAHAPFNEALDYFNHAYSHLGIQKNRFTFERMITRCETAKNKDVGVEAAKSCFKQWRSWCGPEKTMVVEDEALLKGGLGTSGKNISMMWGSMIRNLARNFSNQEALSHLQHFISSYPPGNIIAHSDSLKKAFRSLPSHPSPIRLANQAYPETTSSSPIDRPPHLVFADVKILHLRLANVDDSRSVGVVKGVCKAYEGALRQATESEEGRRRKKRTTGAKDDGIPQQDAVDTQNTEEPLESYV